MPSIATWSSRSADAGHGVVGPVRGAVERGAVGLQVGPELAEALLARAPRRRVDEVGDLLQVRGRAASARARAAARRSAGPATTRSQAATERLPGRLVRAPGPAAATPSQLRQPRGSRRRTARGSPPPRPAAGAPARAASSPPARRRPRARCGRRVASACSAHVPVRISRPSGAQCASSPSSRAGVNGGPARGSCRRRPRRRRRSRTARRPRPGTRSRRRCPPGWPKPRRAGRQRG